MNSKQRNFLRKAAHNLEPIVRIGKDGYNDTITQSILDAMSSRELIKVKILQNCEVEKDEIYKQMIEVKDYEVVSMTGRIITLYKENKDKPTVSLGLKAIK